MFAKHTLFLLVVALVEARFGQEQGNGAIQAINALGDIGQSGQAGTLAGGSIQFLLAAANPCQKLVQADKIVETLGTDDRVIAAARGYVGAEQNFNPFNVKVPNICAEPDLPKTKALRGVVPLIDPDVEPKDIENANAKASLLKPFDATGKSVAEVMAANGFTNFTAVKLDGTKVDVTGGAAKGAANGTVGAAAVGATGGENKDNKNAASDKKDQGNTTGAEEGQGKKETEEKQKATSDDENQNQIKACSTLTSSSDKSEAAGANEKAGDTNEKAKGENEDDKKAGGANEKAGGDEN